MRLLFLLLFLTLALTANSKEALLIGNSNYKHITDLENPKPSIKKLKKVLEQLDFHVTTAYNLDAENLSATIEQFRDRLLKDSIGFLYYSGHGCQLNHQSYLVPTNVDTKKSSKIKYHALSINELLDTLSQANNRVNMLFLDACRDVPVGARGGTKGLGQINTTPKGTLVVYATESGKTADDTTLFISELTHTLLTPNQKIWEIGNTLSNTIATKTNDRQVPEMFSKRLPSRLVLLGGYVPTTPPSTPTPINPNIVKIGNLMYQNQPFTKEYTWKEAKSYCQGLTLGEYSDWRLPTRAELNKISNISMYGKYDDNWKKWFDTNKHKRLKGSKGRELFVRKEFLENMQTGWYFWTSEEKDSSYAWGVLFYIGADSWRRKSGNGYALCVR